jgi:tetratricopeptide (TPR) repeat protein
MSLKASHSHREKGNEHFKRGDYSSAHQAYTTSISHLPPKHPITMVLLTNRALTALKIGEPKSAITDADTALSIIGVSKGESETVDFQNEEPPKPMREYYGKSLMRKAEALEQMEKWSEALLVWQEAVEGGHGGATSMQGRLRAEKAANPQLSRPKPKPPVARKAPALRSAPKSLSASKDSAAVSALRAANAAAEKADDEKFALSDSVDGRINVWKNGKQDNLRALLGSLDTVLWEGSGWKKISMADLVLPGKVKIQYMKGIGKVHPDKVSSFSP